MAEHDEGQEQQSEGSALRRQLEDALAQNKQLSEQLGQFQRRDAFREAGIDTSKGVGKLLAQTYDGDLEADAIKAWASEYDIDFESGGSDRRAEAEAEATTQRMDALRQNSRPDASGQKLSVQEWHELSSRDPLAAQQAHSEGRVDFPPHMAQQLAENRQATRLGG